MVGLTNFELAGFFFLPLLFYTMLSISACIHSLLQALGETGLSHLVWFHQHPIRKDKQNAITISTFTPCYIWLRDSFLPCVPATILSFH